MRNRLLPLLLSFTTSLGLGCGGRPDAGAQADADPLRRAVAIGVGADRYLTELPSRPDLGKYPLNAGVFDTLARMNEHFDVEPMLADRWTFSSATNTYRFVLRKGALFHDGAELTAEDVKYTFDSIIRANPDNYEMLGPGSVRVQDRYTVDISPTSTNNRLVEQLVHPIWGVNRRGSDPLKPIGTGPFRFVEYVRHDRFVVDRFASYWNEAHRAHAGRLTFQFVPDAQARVLALRAGGLDLISEVAPPVVEELQSGGMRVIRSDVGVCDSLAFNIRGEVPYVIGSDPAVRAAVALAIDRQTVVRSAWRDSAEVSTTWIPPQMLGPYRSRIAGPAHDPVRAGQVLDAAGWQRGSDGIRMKAGQRLSLLYVVGFPTADHLHSPELIQDQLRRAGVETRIELTPDAAVSNARRRGGQYDLLQAEGNQNEAYPCFLPDLLYYSKSGSASNRFVSPGGRTDHAIEACRSAPDVESAREHAADAIHELVDVEHILIPLAGVRRIWVTRSGVTGLVPHPSDTNQRWEGVSVTR